MFEGWGEFFFMVGSSAAALIGLMFVVVTLSAGRDRQQMEAGKHLYTSPIVFHLAVVLLLSGAAIAPTVRGALFAIVSGAIVLLGLALTLRSAVGIWRMKLSGADSFFDMWWYGIIPALVYVTLGCATLEVWAGTEWAATAVAGALMALLLVSIHAEWDLVTFLAPMAEPAKPTADKTP
jgi:cytochrome bd-type quinol oxidase subunit 2